MPQASMRQLITLLVVLCAPLAVFGAMVAADRAFGAPGRGFGYVIRLDLPPPGGAVGLPPVAGPADASRPLVVIDPGHGGHDPGASRDGIKEKQLTLALARALRDELVRGGGIRVALTRDDDRFLTLTERSGVARRLKADLFISIHADSTEAETDASGATIYTLSERGSSEIAERLAERENRADAVNGIALDAQTDAVNAILVDLSQRETQARSEAFARLVMRTAQGRLPLRQNPLQSAAFVVLKSPDMPSVLIETGYINNAADVARLIAPAGRRAFAETTAEAIRVHFARQAVP
jgi:N-acetylmuramoyl-L-alanine amidase